MRCHLLGHQLIDRDRVALGLADLAAGKPDRLAAVVVAEPVGMVQAADRRDLIAMLLEHRERGGKAIVAAIAEDLPLAAVHAVGQVDEDAAAGLCGGGGSGSRPRWPHAIEERQGEGGAEAAKHVATVNERRGTKHVHRNLPLNESELAN